MYHFENSVILALKSNIFTFYACDINKGDIWLQFEKLKKKSPDGAVIKKYQKILRWISPLLTCPRDPMGYQKMCHHLLNMPLEVWCAKMHGFSYGLKGDLRSIFTLHLIQSFENFSLQKILFLIQIINILVIKMLFILLLFSGGDNFDLNCKQQFEKNQSLVPKGLINVLLEIDFRTCFRLELRPCLVDLIKIFRCVDDTNFHLVFSQKN